jgi:hypothetical protein
MACLLPVLLKLVERLINFLSRIFVMLTIALEIYYHPLQPNQLTSVLNNITCSVEDVRSGLLSVRPDTSPGPDGIPAMVLVKCADALAPSLCSFFNFSLNKGEVPNSWKESCVITVFKSGDRKLICNYRPIPLNSIFSKILERLVVKGILKHLKNNDFINMNQHGFIPSRSCTTLLSHILSELHNALNIKGVKQVDAISLDWSKAFDVIPHNRLLLKLNRAGIQGSVFSWIKSFLFDRHQCVLYKGSVSDRVKVTSGVPQGSVLGPLLFTIFMMELPRCVKSPLSQYADDTTIYNVIKDENDCSILQNDLNSLSLWCKSNDMALLHKKCTFNNYLISYTISLIVLY